MERYKRTFSAGLAETMEFPLRSKTGVYRWFLNRWVPLKDESGKVVRWFGTNTDIHEQKLFQDDQEFRANIAAAMNSTENIFELVCTATQEIAKHLSVSRCFVTEVEGEKVHIHTDYSENLPPLAGVFDLKSFGRKMPHAWFAGNPISVNDILTDDRTRENTAAYQAMSIGSFVSIPFIRKGNVVGGLNVADSKSRIWTNREIDLMRTVAEQVWAEFERKNLLEALKLSEKRSRFLSNASKVLNSSTLDIDKMLNALSQSAVPEIADWCTIRMLNSVGKFVQVAANHQDPEKSKWAWKLQKKFTPNPDSPVGPYQVVRTGKPELVKNMTDEMIQAGIDNQVQVELLKSVGMRSYICVPINSRGRNVGTISIVTTEESNRRYNEEDLALAVELGIRAGVAVDNSNLYKEAQTVNRLKDEFLANLSHELRTPMNVILGHAGILANEFDTLSESEIAASIQAIDRNAKSQTSIISDLLDVSSIITGKVVYNPQQIKPTETMKHILESLKPTATAKSIKLELISTNAPEIVVADETRLHQIVWNLISNAIKFTDVHGEITVSLTKTASSWSISVVDTGLGIDKEFLPFVFDRFRQEDASTTRKFGGLGLGLSVVRHLVELHGGTVKAESLGRGHGSVFTVTLPLLSTPNYLQQDVKNPAEDFVQKISSETRLDSVKILLVEDSFDSRILVKRMLVKAGANVVEAESAEEARQKLKNFKPDIVVSDIGMPDEDGIEFMKKLRKNNSVPAVALTAFVRPEEKEAVLKAGFQAHIGKPVTAAKLVHEISKVI